MRIYPFLHDDEPNRIFCAVVTLSENDRPEETARNLAAMAEDFESKHDLADPHQLGMALSEHLEEKGFQVIPPWKVHQIQVWAGGADCRTERPFLVQQAVTGLKGWYFSHAVVIATSEMEAVARAEKYIRTHPEEGEGGETCQWYEDRIRVSPLADGIHPRFQHPFPQVTTQPDIYVLACETGKDYD